MAAEHAIPTIDLTPLRSGSDAEKRDVARQIDAACRDTGFFMVTGHGVPADLITKARQRAIDFFALPDDEKMKVQRPPSKISRGYNWVGDRAIAYSMGEETPPDIQEAFGFGQDRPTSPPRSTRSARRCTRRTSGRSTRTISARPW